MKKKAEAFRSIGEVAKLIGVAPHVLRYWETQFSQLKPMKRPDGRRYYRPDDVHLAAGLCDVLRDEGLTIRGAKKVLARDRGESVRERGMARLGWRRGGDLPPDAGDTATPWADALPAQTEHDVEEELDMAAHTPKSRHRKRRSHADGRELPLFPDLHATPNDSAWLARLVTTTALLRQARDLSGPSLSQAGRLRDTIAQTY